MKNTLKLSASLNRERKSKFPLSIIVIAVITGFLFAACDDDIDNGICTPNPGYGEPKTFGNFEYINYTEPIEKDGIYCQITLVAITKYTGSEDSVTIPAQIDGKQVTNIANNAFQGCTSIISVTIPDSVTSIGGGAFSYCTSLTGVTIPDSVTSIGSAAFHSCTSLTSVTLGNSVISIGNAAFGSCDSLTGIIIPDSVISIESAAFNSCTSLTSVAIGNGVTGIGELFFFNCTKLASVTLGNSVASIGDYAFRNCGSLTSITIPDSVTSIAVGAFDRCRILTSVTFQGTIPSSGFSSNAFLGDLRDKHLAGGMGTYTTTALVSDSSMWTKQ